MTNFTTTASNPSFTRLLRRRWGADLGGLKPDTVTSKELFGVVEQQAALIQQLVEEMASYMGTTPKFYQYAPQEISWNPTVTEGKWGGNTTATAAMSCREGEVATLTVSNPASKWIIEDSTIEGGMSAKFDGVASFDVICANAVYTNHVATHIAFRLPNAGFGPDCTVMEYYDGYDPDPENLGVTVNDPMNLFPFHYPNALGKAHWDPNDQDYNAVECETFDFVGGGGYSPCDEHNYKEHVCQTFVHGQCECAPVPPGGYRNPDCPVEWCDMLDVDVFVRFELKSYGLVGYTKTVTVITDDVESEEILIFRTTDCM